MFNKKGLGPVVGTALLLVVAVAAVVGFQSWFSEYSSTLFTDAEVQSNSALDNPVEVDRLIGNTLYLVNNNQENVSVNKVELDSINCPLTQDLIPGVNRINVSSCLENTTTITPDVVVVTNDGIYTETVFLNEQSLTSDVSTPAGGTGPSVVESNGNFNLLSNGVVTCNGVSVGDSATLNGTTYTAVSNQNLSDKIISEDTNFYETACTSLVTDFNVANSNTGGVFYNVDSSNPDVSHWDTSSVTDMSYLFYSANSFNQPLNNWDTSSVTDMSYTFYYAAVFDQPLDNWDTSSVTQMDYMFRGAGNFNQPLSWDTINVLTMRGMFFNVNTFNQPLNFDTSNVQDMNGMFNSASSFNQSLNFNTQNVTDMNYMFASATSFDQDLTGWCVTNIGTEPTDFAFNSPLNTSGLKPVWGTCP